MEKMDFSQPSRQSSKGILLIFVFNTIKLFRTFFAVFIALAFALFKSNSIMGLSLITIFLLVIAILILTLIISVLKYLNFKFHLSEADFHLTSGILNKESTIIPKSKIQNVYLKQSFLQQIINVVSLKIETAGDKKSEVEIAALDKTTALILKKQLFEQNQTTDAQQGVYEDKNVFFKISNIRLILEGVFQNHLKSFIVITSFVFGLYYEFKDYLALIKIDSMRLNNWADNSILNSLFASLMFILIVAVCLILYSIIKTYVINFNLEVIESHKNIEITKGLFNKVSLVLIPSRIQNIVIKTNRVKRYFNLHTLYVKQAMTNVKDSKNFGVIGLEKNQLDHLIDKLLNGYATAGELNKPEPYYKGVLAVRMIFLIVILNIVAYIFFDLTAIWINVVLIPYAISFVYLRYKKSYYNITNKFITVGSGTIDSTTDIMEVSRIQAVKLSQNLFQKRKKITSVGIYSASKSVVIPYVKEVDAKSIHDFLLFKVESQDTDWM